ncbi:hypothetical protein ACFQI7_11040 [Paenibacillus allorhizosphaerae]|uniref:hypothetical protein n=1 Tax=Paenibacillus allorhizosphaerae TaxID=2849866 RepID=UPI001C406DDC|nr:hypothetical protein [Paenibacillus allorhizosphaerae]
MSNSKQFMQGQLRRWKSAASQLISSGEPTYELENLELENDIYDKCKQMAEAEQTTVSAVVHYILEQYFAGRSHELMVQATMEQKEKNPLLQLDALVKRNEKFRGEESGL